jgi:hypothetical protein
MSIVSGYDAEPGSRRPAPHWMRRPLGHTAPAEPVRTRLKPGARAGQSGRPRLILAACRLASAELVVVLVGLDQAVQDPGELAPSGQAACPGRDAELVKYPDEPAVAAVFAGELPGKQPRRGRIDGRGHVARLAGCRRSRVATGSGTSSQSAPTLSRVPPPAQETSVVRSAAMVLACWP